MSDKAIDSVLYLQIQLYMHVTMKSEYRSFCIGFYFLLHGQCPEALSLEYVHFHCAQPSHIPHIISKTEMESGHSYKN